MSIELSKTLQATIDGLSENFPDKLINVYQSSGDTFVHVESEAIHGFCSYLKDEHHFVYLSDIIGTDRYTSDERFEVIYNLLSLKNQTRLFVKVRLDEENPVIDTVSSIWPAANWNERELYDMFGVQFNNHPDHRRIFLPEDFQYYPLRKEFPLLGIQGSIELPNTTPDRE